MRWKDIPSGARNYILYHTIVSPFLITWYMLPLYMFMTGYNVLEVGLFFTGAHIASIPLTYLVGKVFDKVALRPGLVIIDVLDGVSLIFYSLAYGPIAPLMLFVGLIVDKIAGIFYPIYQAVERILYPEDRMEEVFAWHMRLPELSQFFGFLFFGYLFGYVFVSPRDFRIGFLLFGLSSVFTVFFILKKLPRLDVKERVPREKISFKIDKEFRIILLVEGLTTLGWMLAPTIVLLNYIVVVLGYTLFEAMIVEASISIGAIMATFISERISRGSGFKAMAVGYLLITLWATIMSLNPPLYMVIIAHFIGRLGDTLAFPFYRSWIFRKIPKDRASSLMASLSSYRKIISLITPAIAGGLAKIQATLPYKASLLLYLLTIIIFIYLHKTKSSILRQTS